MRPRTITALAALTAAALTGGLLTLSAGTAAAAASGPSSDFNGDGYGDLAATAEYATVGSASQAGAVVITYGSKSGITSTATQVIDQSSPGVPGTPETDDVFGSALAHGDFDHDGYADLAVGAPGEDVDSATDQGLVTILWGSPAGLSGGDTLSGSTASKGAGTFLVSGDFNGDGRDDLALAQPGSNVVSLRLSFVVDDLGLATRSELLLASAIDGSGPESLTSGDVNGDGLDDLLIGGNTVDGGASDLHRNALYLLDDYSSGSHQPVYAGDAGHGTTAAIGDVDKDGYGDIVTGNPWDATAYPYDGEDALGGAVTLVHGSAGGLDTTRPAETITQDTAGIPGVSEANDHFGYSVSLGDLNADGYADLAIGAVYETVGTEEAAGAVTIVPGTANGLSAATSYAYNEGSAGVPGALEAGDYFGSAVRMTDTNGDGKGDLAVGGSGENNEDGSLWSLKGTTSGLSTTGSVSFGAETAGLSLTGTPQFGERITG
ncbi:FG-GAP-like repeat-containing protein [Streptomyces sp. NBC_00118]|uniref:FG-GAP-like repeat-containing protein n=1 Tax=unclassified Streptomyces TaxID=2593676 RepID=UPI0030867A1D|nr:FG-GAP-like repeat-containing protein [Streptomyces sp. NBC_01397]